MKTVGLVINGGAAKAPSKPEKEQEKKPDKKPEIKIGKKEEK